MISRVTMADVARAAGVSQMTVSRALNNKEGISPDTKTQILEIVEKLGYRPSGIARSLVTQRTGTIGLIVPDVSNPYFSGIAHGVADAARQQGLSVFLCDTEEKPENELKFLTVLEENQADGVIMAAPRQVSETLVPLLARHRNVVVINRLFEEHLTVFACGYVFNNDEDGGRLATEHLVRSGHTTIGFLAGPATSYGSHRRFQGYREVLEEKGIPYCPDHTRHCPPTVQGGLDATLPLLQEHPNISALFCFNDMVAIGAMQAGKQLGRRIPEDLAIVGYDDIPMASWVTPALTTCSVPFEEMGRLATELLVAHTENCPEGCENIILQPKLTVRASAP